MKYVPPGGRITVRAGGEAMGHRGMAVVMIEDNGPGIPATRREEVFKRFFRGDHTPGAQPAQAAPSGAGLGLAIVHEIVTLHQGTIRIEDVPAPAGSRAALSVGSEKIDEESDEATGEQPGRPPTMRFVIRIPCEAPGTAA